MKKTSYVVLSKIIENKEIIVDQLIDLFPESNWYFISKKEEFTYERLNKIKPDKIFIPHWSYIIEDNICKDFECIVFHMTDLPYGRGGSPLQNLIVRGHKSTKLTAIRIDKGVDTGPIYLKKPLSLEGKASEIFTRSRKLVVAMIKEIITENLKPIPQQGSVTEFKRRTPEMSDISKLQSLEKIYDYIRMLDADGYPKAFIETDYFKFEFSEAKLNNNNELIANVRILKK